MKQSPPFIGRLGIASALALVLVVTGAAMTFDPFSPTPVAAQTHLPPQDTRFAAVDACILQEMARRNTPGASLAIAIDGVQAYTQTYGVKRSGAPDPVLPSSYFRINSTTKMMAAAAALEQVTETPFAEVVRRDLWEPAGMLRTTMDPAVVLADGDFSHGHMWGQTWLPDAWPEEWSQAGGGAYGTPSELLRWAGMLAEDGRGVLAPESVAAMTTPHAMVSNVPIATYTAYGYGVFVEDFQRRAAPGERVRVLYHPGNGRGYSTELFWVPETGFAVAILANTPAGLQDSALCALREIEDLTRLPVDRNPPTQTTLDRYTGSWAMVDAWGKTWTARVWRAVDGLRIRYEEWSALPSIDAVVPDAAMEHRHGGVYRYGGYGNHSALFVDTEPGRTHARWLEQANGIGQRAGELPEQLEVTGGSCTAFELTPDADLPGSALRAYGPDPVVALRGQPVTADEPSRPDRASLKLDLEAAGKVSFLMAYHWAQADDDLDLYLLHDADGNGDFAWPDELVDQAIGAGAMGVQARTPLPAGAYQLWVHGAQVRGADSTIDLDVVLAAGTGLHLRDVPAELEAGVPLTVELCADALEGDEPQLGMVGLALGDGLREARVRVRVMPVGETESREIYLPALWRGEAGGEAVIGEAQSDRAIIADPGGQIPSLQSDAESGAVLLGPAIPRDLAVLTATGLDIVAYEAGTIVDLASEPQRPIAWIARGSRVYALDTSGESPRELGRTPVLPTKDLELAVGDGIVLAFARGMEDGVWLIDGTDPHAPREVRQLLVGDTVWSAAVNDRQALLAVGKDVLRLDLSPSMRPTYRRVWTVPSRNAGSDMRDLSLEGAHASVHLASRIVLLELRPNEEALARDLSIPGEISAPQLSGGRLFVLSDRRTLHVLRVGRGPTAEPEAELVFGTSINTVDDFAAEGDRLAVTAGSDVRLLDWDNRGQAWTPRPVLDLPWRNAMLAQWKRPSEGRIGVLLLNLTLRTVSAPETPGAEPLLSDEWRPRIELAYSTLARGRHLINVGTTRLQVLDSRTPDRPRVVWNHPLDRYSSFVPGITGKGEWVGDDLWLNFYHKHPILDLADPSRPRLKGHVPMTGVSVFRAHGEHVFVANAGELRTLDPAAEDRPEIVARTKLPAHRSRAIGVVDDVLWVVNQDTDGRFGDALLAYDIRDPLAPRLLSRTSLRRTVVSSETVNDRFIALTTSLPGGIVLLTLFDASDPAAPVAAGSLEFESRAGPMTPFEGRVHVYGHDLLLGLDDRRLIQVDISVPDLLKEAHSVTLPEVPRRIAVTDGLLWVTGTDGGLYGLRSLEPRPPAPMRLWLPIAQPSDG